MAKKEVLFYFIEIKAWYLIDFDRLIYNFDNEFDNYEWRQGICFIERIIIVKKIIINKKN